MENQTEKDFIKYLDELKSSAIKNHPTKEIEKDKRYFYGKFDSGMDKNTANYLNIIKPIVETKLTLVLDSMVSTMVNVKLMPEAEFSNIDKYEMIAEVLDSCVKHVQGVNRFSKLKQNIVKSALGWKSGIMKISWDQDLSEGMGDVSYTYIDPCNFFPDPSAKSIRDCNYIFVKRRESAFTLRKTYQDSPDILEKINKLIDSKSGSDSSDSNTDDKGAPIGISATENNGNVTTQYRYDSSGIKKATTDIDIWECYIQDDTIFIEGDKDSQEEKDVKQREKLKYPNGRVIIYAGSHIIDDKPIEYPFGFPFSVFNATDSQGLFGISETESLILMQERLNRAYRKVQHIIGSHKDKVLIDPITTGLSKDDFTTSDIHIVDSAEGLNGVRHFSTQQLEQLPYLQNLIDRIKQDAKELARVNDSMLSGARPQGVNSGKMLEGLNESPMASIREIQRSFWEFLIDVAEKTIVLIQMFYTNSRIIRISSGKYAAIPQRTFSQGENGEMIPGEESGINVYEKSEGNELYEVVNEIKGDLSLGSYEVKISAGSDIPRSREALSQMTIQLVENGVIGSPDDIEVKELILDTLDYPNRRAIIQRIKERQKTDIPEVKQFDSFVEKVNVSLKDVLEMVDKIQDPATKSQIYTTILGEMGIIPESDGSELPPVDTMQGMLPMPLSPQADIQPQEIF